MPLDSSKLGVPKDESEEVVNRFMGEAHEYTEIKSNRSDKLNIDIYGNE